jgi:diaminohydroxyphosphoribosylaminopyrimidine deaminase / 5-amino-6-(5-phosphoribosylamino)uracil reductase
LVSLFAAASYFCGMHYHELFMQRCLQLAALGQQWVAPNPMVGALVVNNGIIIGEGYHQHFGGPHAEVNAVNAVIDKTLLKGATIYVSLEPCAHFGKTPPCTKLIIEHKIAKVVIACLDPNPLVAGKGAAQLEHAGVEVIIGVLEKDARELNKRFIHYHTHKKPFVVLKWAQTEDGYCGRFNGSNLSHKITNWYSDVMVHQMRSKQSAILVGYNTALNDNPQLTARKWFGKNPIRIIIDLQCCLPQHLNIFTDGLPTLVFTLVPKQDTPTVSYLKVNNKEHFIIEILNILYQKNIQSLLVEGGPKTLQLFIDSATWNEAHIFTSNIKWQDGVKAPVLLKGVEVNSIINFNNTYKKFIPAFSL